MLWDFITACLEPAKVYFPWRAHNHATVEIGQTFASRKGRAHSWTVTTAEHQMDGGERSQVMNPGSGEQWHWFTFMQ